MDKNSTSEPTHQGGGVDGNGLTYIIDFVIGLIFLLLTVGIACVRLRMSQSLYIFNILAGFPPPPRTAAGEEEESQDMEQGLRHDHHHHHDHHNMDNSFESYPKLLYSQVEKRSDSSSCSICLGDYKETDTLRLLPDCGHVYHLACVDPWLRLHSTCPICRKSSAESSTIV